jgi:hypothetical protein
VDAACSSSSCSASTAPARSRRSPGLRPARPSPVGRPSRSAAYQAGSSRGRCTPPRSAPPPRPRGDGRLGRGRRRRSPRRDRSYRVRQLRSGRLRHQRLGVQLTRQHGERRPQRDRTRGKPAQPAPHRASGTAQPLSDPPVPQPGRRPCQRRADHRDRIRPPLQDTDRQQYMRAPAAAADHPPGPQPLAGLAGPPDHPWPGMSPSAQPPATPRAAKPPDDSGRSTSAASLPAWAWRLRAPLAALPAARQKTTGRAGPHLTPRATFPHRSPRRSSANAA